MIHVAENRSWILRTFGRKMKIVNELVNRCADCPFCDGFWHDDASGWCCKSERELDDLGIIAGWCELDDN